MTEVSVPAGDHIARYCGASHVDEDGEIDGSAFRLRRNEEYLSVNWLEFLDSESETQLELLREVYRKKFERVGTNAKIAKLNTSQLIEFVRTESPSSVQLEIRHKPERPVDLSHCGIFNIPENDDVIPDLMAQMVIEVHNAR